MADLNVKKPRDHAPKEHVSVTGTGKPGDRVTVKGLRNVMDAPVDYHADIGDDGKWGVSGVAPRKEGVETISVESTGATTSTTYAVRAHGKPPKPKGKDKK